MDKEKLIEEKQALVAQFNTLQEKINSYGLDIIVENNIAFKKEANLKKRIEERIQQINKLLNSN